MYLCESDVLGIRLRNQLTYACDTQSAINFIRVEERENVNDNSWVLSPIIIYRSNIKFVIVNLIGAIYSRRYKVKRN